MTRTVLFISLTLLLLAEQYVVAQDFCVWCDKDTASQFMSCIIEKLTNDPQFSSIPKNSINDVKNSMLAASNAMTSTSQSSEMKMLNGALAGEISGLVKSQMVITGQSAHDVTAKIMDMIASCYIAVTGKPHAHFVHTLGNAVDFMLSEDQDDYDSPTAAASSSAQSGIINPPNQPPHFAFPETFVPAVPFQPIGPVNNMIPQALDPRFPIRSQEPITINQRTPFNSQPPPISPTNEQPAQVFNQETPFNNQSPREFNQKIPDNNQQQQNAPSPLFNQQRPFNNQLPPTFNRQIPFNEQPMADFNRQHPFIPPAFNQRPQVFNQPPPNLDHQLIINNQPLPFYNQQPQLPSVGNQIVQENRPAFSINNLPLVNNFNPIANIFSRQWNKPATSFTDNTPANDPEQPTDPNAFRPISQPQTFQENKQVEPNNQFHNFPRMEPNLNRNVNFPRTFNTNIYNQIPSQSASSSAVAVSNVATGGNLNDAPNIQHFRINPNDPNIQTPQSENRPEVPHIENQPGQFAYRFPFNAANRPNAFNNQQNQDSTAVASVVNPSNNQPNQAANAFASSAAASETETSNDAESGQEQDSEPIDNISNAEASASANPSHHGKHKPKINSVDSKEACALRFGETLFVYLTNSTTFPKVLGTSTPKTFASMIIPEVNKRAAIDSGYDISADEIEALSKIYVMSLPEGTNSQIYGEKVSKAIMVPLFKTGLLGNSCEDEAKSIGSNILKYLKLAIPYLDNIKGNTSESPSSEANSKNGNAVASASSNSGFPASASAVASATNNFQQSNSNNDAVAVAKSGADDQQYDYSDYYDDYTNDDSYDYKTKQDKDPTPENYRNEYLITPTTAEVDENCDYDEHWQETAYTNQEPEKSDNTQVSSSATAEANSNSQSPFQNFWNLFQKPRTFQTQSQSDSFSPNAEPNFNSQTSRQKLWSFFQGPNEDQVQSSSSSANAEANSNSQAPRQKFWSFAQRPNEDPVQSSSSSANADATSNSQAPRQKIWSFFQRPNEDPVQSSSSSANAEATSNSQAPRQKVWSFFQRPNEDPVQSTSSSSNANSNSQAPRQKLWSFFQKPNEDPVQSSSSSANAAANTNAQSPFGSFWSLFQRPKDRQASSEAKGSVVQQEPGFSPIVAPSETFNSNRDSSSVSNQTPNSVPLQDPVLNQGSGFVPIQPGFALNQGPIPNQRFALNQNSGPYGQIRPHWIPYQGFPNTPIRGPTNPVPGFTPNQGPSVPNQYPKPIFDQRFESIPAQGAGPFANQGFGAMPNRGSFPVQASAQASSQEAPKTESVYTPNKAIYNSPNLVSGEAPTQGLIMEESGEAPHDGPGETEYGESGMSPNIDEELKKMSVSSPAQESGGAPDDELGETGNEGNSPNLGQNANQGSKTEPGQLPDQNPILGLANQLVNSPDANTRSQIDKLKAACIRSITNNGYNYNELTSIMAQISKDLKNIHSHWSGPKILTLTYLETVVACTQVLQNIATTLGSENGRPKDTATPNFPNETPVNRINEAPINRENETPVTRVIEVPVNRVNEAPANIIIQKNNFNERPAIFPPNNEHFILKPFVAPAAASNPILKPNNFAPQQIQNNRNFQGGYNTVNTFSAPNNFRPPAFGQQNSFPTVQRQSFSSASASAIASENNEFPGGGHEFPSQQAV